MRRASLIALLIALTFGLIRAQQPEPKPAATTSSIKHSTTVAIPPALVSKVEADYPAKARLAKLTGRCSVSAMVDSDGIPQDLEIIRCTDRIFEKSSLDAVAKYRFKPGTNPDGIPITVSIAIDVDYTMSDGHGSKIRITYSRYTPPGVTSFEPDSNGIYPYSKTIAPPTLTAFSDQGYGDAAFQESGNSACDMVLTIGQKGKASNPEGVHCVRPGLERFITQSLLDSRYLPGGVNGKPVPVRMAIHLEFVGFFPLQ